MNAFLDKTSFMALCCCLVSFIHSLNLCSFLLLFRVISAYPNMHLEEGRATPWAGHWANTQTNRETHSQR